ncbi:MAG: sigma-70 family RNA polymerase sigma factor [Comamonas sp.]|uniref:sigma-70 family RNA polymerase sigma factor n=1 Tax=Comamonas sp. TaxID=34028 RepID=UPI002FC5A0A8
MPADEVSAAAELFIDHQPWLLARLRRRLQNAADAEDVSSETFVRLLGTRRLLLLDEPRAFLTAIAKNILVDLWRRRDLEQMWVETLAAMPEELAPSPEERALLQESLASIAKALESLSSHARCAFLLSQLDGLAYAEIAAQIGKSERMVRRYVADGLRCCLLAVQD